ncbi:MAG TPA: patatin-like phospholipase family protein [Terracidiphilus sp.]|nr:patatin-like phospholipase family protein [Terracidiphilus sp.]
MQRKTLIVIALGGAVFYYLGLIAHLQLLEMLWIPSLMAAFLLGFPAYAVALKSTLFHGLFDLDLSPRAQLPVRHFAVALSAFAVGASASAIARLELRDGAARYGIPQPHLWCWIQAWVYAGTHHSTGEAWRIAAAPTILAAYLAFFAILHSRQSDKKRSLPMMIAGAVAGIAVGVAAVLALVCTSGGWIAALAAKTEGSCLVRWLGPGYSGTAWEDNLFASFAFLLAFVLYIILGWYGRASLGKPRTIPAVVAPLMLALILGWAGAGLDFFLARWHIPLLLVVALVAAINGKLPGADHTYEMVERCNVKAPRPMEVLTAGGKECAIVVAAAGGGIQAAAWTTKVLQGLHDEHGTAFDRALSCISSISGGSMGSACYVNWLDKGCDASMPTPFRAASASSLDEVAWGLAWPDLIRMLLPFPLGLFLIDRAHAMERAWTGNSSADSENPRSQLTRPLSEWNQKTAEGKLPALIMNSTMVEQGGPLLLGTSDVINDDRPSSIWTDAEDLHVEEHPVSGKAHKDIPVGRAARLSATFPYVTPVARPAKAKHQPHMIDGGLYDNYGMATLSEWLDQALEKQAEEMPGKEQVKRVLVIQINGFPPADCALPAAGKSSAGWVLQLAAPVLALANVRTAGQVSHRDIEFKLLCEKWTARGIAIKTTTFELQKQDAPLSWHLTPREIHEIVRGWDADECAKKARLKVAEFLAGA